MQSGVAPQTNLQRRSGFPLFPGKNRAREGMQNSRGQTLQREEPALRAGGADAKQQGQTLQREKPAIRAGGTDAKQQGQTLQREEPAVRAGERKQNSRAQTSKRERGKPRSHPVWIVFCPGVPSGMRKEQKPLFRVPLRHVVRGVLHRSWRWCWFRSRLGGRDWRRRGGEPSCRRCAFRRWPHIRPCAAGWNPPLRR